MADKIVMSNMVFYGFHGVHEYEREQGQRFYVDLELHGDLEKAGNTDHLNDTIDYASIYAKVEEIVENHRFQLLEALANHISQMVLQHGVVEAVTVRVRKPSVPIPGCLDYVGVEIYRKK